MTGDSCSANSDCPSAADNICGTDGTCAISRKACTSNSDCGDCLCNLCIDEFSNNVGYYHVAFYVAPPTTGSSSLSASRSILRRLAAFKGTLEVDRVTVYPGGRPAGAEDGRTRRLARTWREYRRPDHSFLRDTARCRRSDPWTRSSTAMPAFDEEILSQIRADGVSPARGAVPAGGARQYRILVTASSTGHRRFSVRPI